MTSNNTAPRILLEASPFPSGPAEALLDQDYLASRRVRLWAAGHHTFAVAVNALYDAMKAVRAGTISSQLPHVASRELMDRVTGAADFERWTRQFMGAS